LADAFLADLDDLEGELDNDDSIDSENEEQEPQPEFGETTIHDVVKLTKSSRYLSVLQVSSLVVF
jgi:hypothetical protein